jgi:hypothetical protein
MITAMKMNPSRFKTKKPLKLTLLVSVVALACFFIYSQSIQFDHSLRETQRIPQLNQESQFDTEPKRDTQNYGASKAHIPQMNPQQVPKIDRILFDIKDMKPDISSKEHYALFLALTADLKVNPQNIEKLRDFDIFNEPQNEAQKKQLSLIYGALAQSGRIEAWPLLREALERGSGETVGFQAVSAVADYGSIVPLEAVDSLLKVYSSHPEPYIRNSAFLALGSIAQGRSDIGEKVRPIISNKLLNTKISEPWYDIDVILAAAGNHGDPQYVELVKKFITHPDETIRGRVLFALRRNPAVERSTKARLEIIQWIGQQASLELSAKVQLEGLKSLSEQDLKLEDTTSPILDLETQGAQVNEAIGNIAKNARSLEVLQTSIRLLSHRLRYYPETTSQLMGDLKKLLKESPELSMIDEHLSKDRNYTKTHK